MHELNSNGSPESLRNGDFTEAKDPIALFSEWLAEASLSEINDPNAMALATADSDLLPNVRIVLLKAFDGEGFVFYTNSQSAKGEELSVNAKAALAFHWKSLRRQVRVRGLVEMVAPEEADAYFATRPLQSRVAASASEQSRPLASRAVFEQAMDEVKRRFPGEDIPRPSHWNGYRVIPISIEFWHDRPYRMHDRIAFTRPTRDAAWAKTRLYP